MTDSERLADLVERQRQLLQEWLDHHKKQEQLMARYPISLFRYLTGRCYFQRPEWKELTR